MSIHLSDCGKKGITLLSPAKINLFFRVLSRRSDGYHAIASLFQTISLFDTIDIFLSDEDAFSCDDPEIPCDDSNLVLKALSVFRQKTSWRQPVAISLKKKIPICAGLGGGSSNAATVLWGLNQLSGCNIADAQLGRWAAEFSADAPFFLTGGTAYCEGKGEVITPLQALAPRTLWICKPKEGLSTPRVFQNCNPSLFPPRDPKVYLQKALHANFQPFNDLEPSAFELMPSLKELQSQLLSLGFDYVTMTGSGSAFMCFSDRPISPEFLTDLSVYPVEFLNRNPLSWYKKLTTYGNVCITS